MATAEVKTTATIVTIAQVGIDGTELSELMFSFSSK